MNGKLVALGILAAQVAAVSVEPVACSPTHSGAPPPTDAAAPLDATLQGGDGSASEAGDAAPAADTGPHGLAEGGCFGAVGTAYPDASSAPVYGSCIPRLADGAIPVCYESGHVGEPPDSGGLPSALQTECTSAPVNGTWSAKPCDRTGIVFGCQADNNIGDFCAEVTTTWYYAPATRMDEQAACPPPLFVVFPQ